MILQALLLTASPALQAEAQLPDTEPVFVELTRGRGTLLAGESDATLVSTDGEQWVEGRGHLSLTASAAATLRWHGRASLELYGPCELEWEPCDADGELKWSFYQVHRAMIEARKAPLTMELGEGWIAKMPAGAFTLRGLASGGFEVYQQAGTPASYQWQGSMTLARPAITGQVGRPIRLATSPSPSRPDHCARLEGRKAWGWPWREEPSDVDTWSYRDWPWIAGPPKPVTVWVERAPVTPQPSASQGETIQVQLQPVPEAPESPPEPVIVEQSAPLVPELPEEAPSGQANGEGTWGWESDDSSTATPWRGLDEDGFSAIGEYHVQDMTGILYEELPDGGVRFWIPETYESSGWVLGPRLDARLTPGSAIEFSPSGALREHSGGVRVLAALER